MKITGIICEYNPIHNGHLYQVEQIKKLAPNSYIVAIMSGNYVQRGEPAILNKFKRAELAVKNGIDLVIQLPTLYSAQSAENFALGGLKIIKAINCIDYLSFGVETSNFANLYNTAYVQHNNKEKLSSLISNYMTSGKSYAASYKLATLDLVKNIRDNDKMFMSNSILALEYLKSSFKLNLNIDFIPVKRLGNNYLDEELIDIKYNSATSIRKNIFSNNFYDVIKSIPKNTINEFENLNKSTILNDYYDILKYNFLIGEKNFSNITGYEKGIDNLLKKNILKSKSVTELVEHSISKRYKKSRLQRYLINYLLGIEKSFVDNVVNHPVNYIKILGFNKNGKKILKEIKKNSDVEIVTKNKDFTSSHSIDKKLFNLEERATDLYNLKNPLAKREYEFKPYIKTP